MRFSLAARHARVASAVWLVVLWAVPASAQTRLYLMLAGDHVFTCTPTDCEPSTILDVDVDGRRVLAQTAVLNGRIGWGLSVTPDGQHLVWRGAENISNTIVYDEAISLFDTSTRRQQVVWSNPVGPTGPFLMNPAAVRAYAQLGRYDPITVFDAAGQRLLAGDACTRSTLSGISQDGSRLALSCPGGGIEVVDSLTGVVVGRVTSLDTRFILNGDGGELYTSYTTNHDVVVRRYDVATGTLLAVSAALPSTSGSLMAHDARTGRVVVLTSAGGAVLDSQTLGVLGGFSPPPNHAIPLHLVLDPQRPEAYTVWGQAFPPHPASPRYVLSWANIEVFATLAETALPGDQAVSGMVLGPRPPRPLGLAATRSGTTVTLQWSTEASRSIGTGLVVEAGSAPGVTNLARLPVAAGETMLVVPGVPPGAYYVRVRAVNGTGAGEPSNEVLVVVP